MADQDLWREIKGNIFLYRQGLPQRTPRSFLARNLKTILEAHQRELVTQIRTGNAHALPHRDSLQNESHRSNSPRQLQWAFPTREMLERIMCGSPARPVLRIDGLQLRPLNVDKRLLPRRVNRTSAQDPEWMPSSDNILNARSRVEVQIRNGEQYPIYVDSRRGQLKGYESEDGQRIFKLTLDQAFDIELHDLVVTSTTHTDVLAGGPQPSGERTFTLDVAIHCESVRYAGMFVSLLEANKPKDYFETPSKALVVRSSWHALPRCPNHGELMALYRIENEEHLKMKYGMELTIGWNRHKGTPLEMCNRMQSSMRTTQQLPTPDESEGFEVQRPPHRLRYTYRDPRQSRVYLVPDLRCVFCRSKRTYTTMFHLLAHYKNDHEHFEFELSEYEEEAAAKGGIISACIAFRKPAKSIILDGSADISWYAPRHAFNVEAYVTKGEYSWKNGATSKASRGKLTQDRSARGAVQCSHTTTGPTKRQRDLDQVEDVPLAKRREYGSLHTEGVTFYHTVSKQRVELSDCVSEEDDHLEEARLADSNHHKWAQLGLNESAAEFHEAFQRHMDYERPESHLLLRDALVRFVRKHMVQLAQSDWESQFAQKLNLLVDHGIIESDVAEYCMGRTSNASVAPKLGPVASPRADVGFVTDHRHPTTVSSGRLSQTASSRPSSHDVGDIERHGRRTEVPESPDALNGHDWESRPSTPSRAARPRPQRQRLVNGTLVVCPRPSTDQSRYSDGRRHRDTTLMRESPSIRMTGNAEDSPSNAISNRLTPHSTTMRVVDAIMGPDFVPPPSKLTRGESAQTRAKQYGRCFCGQPAAGGRGCVACDDPNCARGNFHVRCVDLERAVSTWKCRECVSPKAARWSDVGDGGTLVRCMCL